MIPFHKRMAIRRGYTVDYDLTDKKQKRKMAVGNRHAALGTTTVEPFPPNTEMIMFGMGCYWGAGTVENLYYTCFVVFFVAKGNDKIRWNGKE